jgi:hypothetical protein
MNYERGGEENLEFRGGRKNCRILVCAMIGTYRGKDEKGRGREFIENLEHGFLFEINEKKMNINRTQHSGKLFHLERGFFRV